MQRYKLIPSEGVPRSEGTNFCIAPSFKNEIPPRSATAPKHDHRRRYPQLSPHKPKIELNISDRESIRSNMLSKLAHALSQDNNYSESVRMSRLPDSRYELMQLQTILDTMLYDIRMTASKDTEALFATRPPKNSQIDSSMDKLEQADDAAVDSILAEMICQACKKTKRIQSHYKDHFRLLLRISDEKLKVAVHELKVCQAALNKCSIERDAYIGMIGHNFAANAEKLGKKKASKPVPTARDIDVVTHVEAVLASDSTDMPQVKQLTQLLAQQLQSERQVSLDKILSLTSELAQCRLELSYKDKHGNQLDQTDLSSCDSI